MDNGILGLTLSDQERRGTKLFLYLFYFVSLAYDVVYHLVFPLLGLTDQKYGFDAFSGFAIYVILLLLLPITFYFFRKNNPSPVKYIYFVVYTFIGTVSEIIINWQHTGPYKGGNLVEVILILFSPIFVNIRFFLTVTLGTILRYVVLGFIFRDTDLMVPIILILGISIAALMILNRFIDNLKALESNYENQLEGIVKGIIATLELKDPYTRGHSERVAHYSQMLARRHGGFTESQLKTFYYACLLHDIGKVNIPDHILTKVSRLTKEEYEVIKSHPQVGSEAIQSINGLEDCRDVILYHHERWDGHGYPCGLKGEEIPILARIASIADAFDAMTTLRSYRSALSPEEAYDRIMDEGDAQFDPRLIPLFQELYAQWKDNLNSNQWKEAKASSH